MLLGKNCQVSQPIDTRLDKIFNTVVKRICPRAFLLKRAKPPFLSVSKYPRSKILVDCKSSGEQMVEWNGGRGRLNKIEKTVICVAPGPMCGPYIAFFLHNAVVVTLDSAAYLKKRPPLPRRINLRSSFC